MDSRISHLEGGLADLTKFVSKLKGVFLDLKVGHAMTQRVLSDLLQQMERL